MRCADCNKFVAFEEPHECETDGAEVQDTEVIINVRCVRKCAECSQEMKDAEIEARADIEHECTGLSAWREKHDGEDAFELVSSGEPEPTDRLQEKDRNGRPIRSHRFKRHYLGFTAEVELKCNACEESFTVTLNAEEQASGFNEL